jgi:hypothetical protein
MQILRQLPFRDVPTSVVVAADPVPLRAYQIPVWVSLVPEGGVVKGTPRFPAVLDTGHSHNFSIQESLLLRWAGLRLEALRRLGDVTVNRQEVPLMAVDLWVHRNKPGTAELLPKPFKLEVLEGIAVYPNDAPNAPRLPLLGLRGLVRNRLRLTLDGRRLSVSLWEER